MNQSLVVPVTLKISYTRIADLICCGIECGELASFGYDGYKKVRKFWGDGKSWDKFYGHINPALTDDSYVVLYERHHKKERKHKLDIVKIRKGLAVMAEKSPHQFALFQQNNEDAITGDVFLQCCLLGEVVYG